MQTKEKLLEFSQVEGDIWRGKFGSFYTMRNLSPPIDHESAVRILGQILADIRFGVTSTRSNLNLPTKWKMPGDRVLVHLEEYARMLELKDKNRLPYETHGLLSS